MNALPIRSIAETADSVMLNRADFETLAELLSFDAMARVAAALRVPMDLLVRA